MNAPTTRHTRLEPPENRDVELARQAGILLTVLGETVPNAIATGTDVRIMALRLGAIIDSGRALLADLESIACRIGGKS